MTEMSWRFEPRKGEPYARCRNCDVVFETKELASAHMHETFKARTTGSSGHSIQVQNRTRAERIKFAVGSIIDDAITDAIDEIFRFTYGRGRGPADATEEEITEALRYYGEEFGDAWARCLADNAEDNR